MGEDFDNERGPAWLRAGWSPHGFEPYNEPCLLVGLFIKLKMGFSYEGRHKQKKGVVSSGFSCYNHVKTGEEFQ